MEIIQHPLVTKNFKIMKTKILLFNLLLLIVSCKAQINTYSEETLKKQSEKINGFQQQKRMAKISKMTIGDIIDKLDVPIISFGFDNESWESQNANLIMLKFYTQREGDYKIDNKINLHKIYIYIKNPVKSDVVLQLTRRNQGKWTKEVNDYFKDMEVDSVKAN